MSDLPDIKTIWSGKLVPIERVQKLESELKLAQAAFHWAGIDSDKLRAENRALREELDDGNCELMQANENQRRELQALRDIGRRQLAAHAVSSVDWDAMRELAVLLEQSND